MSEPFIGEIRMFASNFAPRGWAFCDGQLLQVSQHDALFSLLGTIYGGDGRTTFGLPDLRGRVPLHQGTGPGLSQRRIGSRAGAESTTLTLNQIPSHSHSANCATGGNDISPVGKYWSTDPGGNSAGYNSAGGATMASTAIANTGGSRSHENRQPTLAIGFIISLFGIYPSRT